MTKTLLRKSILRRVSFWGGAKSSWKLCALSLQIIVLVAREAGTLLADVGEVAVAADLRLGIGCLEILQEEEQRLFLLQRPGVGITALLIHAALVADADGMLVVVEHMGAGILLRTAFVDVALTVDVPVIADHGPAPGTMPAVDVLDSDVLGRFRGAAVDYQVQDILHGLHLLRGFLHRAQRTWLTHDCTKKVDTVRVMMVATYLSTLPMRRLLSLRNLNMGRWKIEN